MTASSSVDPDVYHAVAEVLVRYATAIDSRDWTLLRSCFTDACDADYGDIGTWQSAEEIADFMHTVHEPCGHTLHRITNISVAATPTGATARCYVDAVIMMADTRTGVRAVGYYDDELTREDGWRIARRRFTSVLLQQVTNDGAPTST